MLWLQILAAGGWLTGWVGVEMGMDRGRRWWCGRRKQRAFFVCSSCSRRRRNNSEGVDDSFVRFLLAKKNTNKISQTNHLGGVEKEVQGDDGGGDVENYIFCPHTSLSSVTREMCCAFYVWIEGGWLRYCSARGIKNRFL